MYRRDILANDWERLAVERRRANEAARSKRIFNAKQRTIGHDLEGLQTCIQQKLTIKDMEKEREENFNNMMRKNAKLLEIIDKQVERAKQEDHKQLEKFRVSEQLVSHRRDFDLYDPDALKKDLPGRVGDLDPRNHVSGLQKFVGEDLLAGARQKEQKLQMRVWAQQQLEEKRQHQNMEKKLKNDWEKYEHSMGIKCDEAIQSEEEAKRRACREQLEQNAHLAQEKKERERQQRLKDLEQEHNELEYNLNSDILTERPNHKFGNCIRVDHFRGASKEEIEAVLNGQAEQRRQKEEMLREQEREERSWMKTMNASRKLVYLVDRKNQRENRQLQLQMQLENMRLAKDAQDRENYRNKVLYTNPPTEAYFSQFNTTSR